MVVFLAILLLMKFINDILNDFCILTCILKGWLPIVCDFSGLMRFFSWIETPSFIITVISMGFPDSSAGKESTCNAGDPGSIPRSGRSPGEGIGYPLQYSGPENGVTKRHNWATFTFTVSLELCG